MRLFTLFGFGALSGIPRKYAILNIIAPYGKKFQFSFKLFQLPPELTEILDYSGSIT
jgi:hypothetical protein